MLSLLAMPFFSRALIALCAAGVSFPVLGTFILHLELIPARFAVMHGALLGAAAALLLGLNPAGTAMAASVIAGIGVAVISWRGKVSAGGSLGLIMTLCMGLAFIIFYKSNVHAVEAFNILWGNILTLTDSDARLILLTGGGILLFLIAAYKEIHLVLYDRVLAQASGVPAKLIYGGIMLAVCAGIAAAMQVTGALMLDAVTLLPALAARRLGKSFRGLILWGSLLGAAMNLAGFALAFALDLPVGPAIILTGSIGIGAVHGIGRIAAGREQSIEHRA
ncbi:MAG: metal ABC transporter permease [Treponema sp.]|jgi:zinc transport system permease protein|nr:metal ABC transporter permease [Treponema sp.]